MPMHDYILKTPNEKIAIAISPVRLVKVLSLFVLTLFVFVASLSIGSTLYNPLKVISHLTFDANPDMNFVINHLRLPRVTLSLLVGASLGTAGLILQSMVRNPLASPDILGITGGAKVSAVLFLTFLHLQNIHMLPLVAIGGATLAFILLYIFAWNQGISPVRLILVGIGFEALFSALVTMLIVLSPTYSTSEAYIWLTGSVYGANWSHVTALFPWFFVLMILTHIKADKLSVLELGDDIATGLGISNNKLRFFYIIVAVFLSGSAIAFAGGIGFVGLIAPHISRKVSPGAFKNQILSSALIGAMIVMAADTFARTVFLPLDIPAGVFVSGIGAPFFIYLLYKDRYK